MAKAVCKLQYTHGGGEQGWDGLDNLIDSFQEILTRDVDAAMYEDSKRIATDMAENFENYIDDNAGEKEFRKYFNPTIRISKDGDGYTISMTGKNLLYYEFGTGDKGEQTNTGYSQQDLAAFDYAYNTGPNVIGPGAAINSYSTDELPQWYMDFQAKHPGVERHNWWMSPYGKSNGIRAGMFIYNAWDDYITGLESEDDEYQSGADISGIRRTGIRTLKTTIANDLKQCVRK